jgi:alkanesulfonate monooxygenase SsuD/methylene tetrahydromethanopterin reductase-like flavin-dependent oxidoreductase (luciferase family)
VLSVRPVGPLGSVGLILPTIPWQEIPGEPGITTGATTVLTTSATDRLRSLVSAAEGAGATGLWACDHLFWHRPLLEPLTSLAVAATASTSATLGTCVLQLPLRNPAAVARQASTLQLLTGGRFVLGLGVGSHRGEYDAADADFSRRGEQLDDGIAALTRAWDSAGDPNEHYRLEPSSAPIPIWLAGTSAAAISRAARVGDGWVPMFVPADEYRSARTRLLELVADAGRDPGAMDTAVVALVCAGDSAEVARKEGTTWLSDLYALPPKAFERHLIAGSPEDCAAGIAAYHDAGAGHVVVMVAADETLDHFGPVLEAFGSRSSRGPVDLVPEPVSSQPNQRLGVAQ